MTGAILHLSIRDGELEPLLAQFRAAVQCDLVALVSSPRRWAFARIARSAASTAESFDFGGAALQECIKIEDVFELRAFCETAEFRWRRVAGTIERAAVLTEASLALAEWHDEATIVAACTQERGYVLWGRATASGRAAPAPGWTILAAARIGFLRAPVECDVQNAHARLTALEYVAVEGEHGNAYVAAERLTGLKPYAAEPRSKGREAGGNG